MQVFRAEIWGGLFASDSSMARPKRHILYSNDEMFLKRLAAFAASATKEQLNNMKGEPLVKPCTKPDGSRGFCGNGDTMKQSQHLGCNLCIICMSRMNLVYKEHVRNRPFWPEDISSCFWMVFGATLEGKW